MSVHSKKSKLKHAETVNDDAYCEAFVEVLCETKVWSSLFHAILCTRRRVPGRCLSPDSVLFSRASTSSTAAIVLVALEYLTSN